MNRKLQATYDRYAAVAFDKQLELANRVKDLDWSFQMDAGLLEFGDKFSWNIQILGTESDESQTWLWSWANKQSDIPKSLIVAAERLKRVGEEKNIPELGESILSSDVYGGQFWSVIAMGLCIGDAYYKGPHEGGAVYFMILDPTYKYVPGEAMKRLITNFPEAIMRMRISNHKASFLRYADFLGVSVQENGQSLVVSDGAGEMVVAEFDGANRLMELSGNLKQETVGERK